MIIFLEVEASSLAKPFVNLVLFGIAVELGGELANFLKPEPRFSM
ncbi:hypothetical protein [Bacteroides stercoris]